MGKDYQVVILVQVVECQGQCEGGISHQAVISYLVWVIYSLMDGSKDQWRNLLERESAPYRKTHL